MLKYQDKCGSLQKFLVDLFEEGGCSVEFLKFLHAPFSRQFRKPIIKRPVLVQAECSCQQSDHCLIKGCSHHLLLVGSLRPRGSVVSLIDQLGLRSCVRILGHVADAELPLAYRVADVFAFCSLSEGFGIPLLEAMVSGVPVVTSSCGAMAEVAGEAARLVDPHSADSIAEGLSAVLSSETVRRGLIERGRRRAQAFQWEETARQTLAVYRQAAGQAAGGSAWLPAVSTQEPLSAVGQPSLRKPLPMAGQGGWR